MRLAVSRSMRLQEPAGVRARGIASRLQRPAVFCLAGFSLVLGLTAPGRAAGPVEKLSTAAPRTPADERRALHVPDGFEVQLVAAEPAVRGPINIAFDDRGRL